MNVEGVKRHVHFIIFDMFFPLCVRNNMFFIIHSNKT